MAGERFQEKLSSFQKRFCYSVSRTCDFVFVWEFECSPVGLFLARFYSPTAMHILLFPESVGPMAARHQQVQLGVTFPSQ